jgi:hypothetical protein
MHDSDSDFLKREIFDGLNFSLDELSRLSLDQIMNLSPVQVYFTLSPIRTALKLALFEIVAVLGKIDKGE